MEKKWVSDTYMHLGKEAGEAQYAKDGGALKTSHTHMQPLIGPEALSQLPSESQGIIERDSFIESFRDAYLDKWYAEHPE